MELLDILYTPLDVPPKPEYNINELSNWLTANHHKLAEFKDYLAGTGNTAAKIIENYPWDLTVAYFNVTNNGPGWLGNFDKTFPELSKYIYECFNMTIDDLGLVIFLPIRSGHTGLGFWHNDTDSFALRHYFEFEFPEKNKLLMRRTKEQYDIRPGLKVPIDESLLQEQIIDCKILNNRQSFFLNNVRSVHSTYTEVPNCTRIACFVTFKFGMLDRCKEVITDLVTRSAKKYEDYAVFWDPNAKSE